MLQSTCARAGGRHAPLADDGPRPLFETGAAGHDPNLPTHTDSSGHVLEHCTTPFALHLWTKPGRITPAGTGPLRGSASGSTALVAAAARSVGGHVAGHGEQRGEGQAERHTTAMTAACVDTLCSAPRDAPGQRRPRNQTRRVSAPSAAKRAGSAPQRRQTRRVSAVRATRRTEPPRSFGRPGFVAQPVGVSSFRAA
jgi:hypothetical protein